MPPLSLSLSLHFQESDYVHFCFKGGFEELGAIIFSFPQLTFYQGKRKGFSGVNFLICDTKDLRIS